MVANELQVGFGKVRLRSAFAALVGEMLDESTTVEGVSCLPGWDNAVEIDFSNSNGLA